MLEKLKVIFFGYGGHAHLAEAFRPLIEELGMVLITIHEHDDANVKWGLKTWREELNKADIIILPCDYKRFPAKSANKLTQSLSMGKPVVCSPLDSYKVIEEKYPGCCLFADSQEEWKEQLLRLRNSPDFRKELGQKGIVAAQEVHIDRIGEKWAKVLQNIKVSTDIVIPTYNNLRGLRLCIESIRQCTPETHTIIAVNNGQDPQIHEYLTQQKDVTYIKKDRMTFAQAVNAGIKAGQGQYVMILNDDVIVSQGWLGGLLNACGAGIGAVGPLSNCDKGWLHNYGINIGGVDLIPGANTFEQIEPVIPSIYAFKSPYREIVEREWVAFYCTLIPKDVLNKVGCLCEEYINSGEDVDLCKRIRLMGYRIVQNYGSFVFHFGAVSRRGAEKEDYKKYHEEDDRTQQILKRIWEKKTVVLYSGPSWEKWDYRSLDRGGIGGSETWQVWLAREIQKKGYRVISFCDCNDHIKDYENSPEYVDYRPYTEFPKYIEDHYIDYLILSRSVDPLDLPVRAGKIFVQIHDLWLLSGQTKTHADKVTKFSALSDWHLDFASEYHKIPKDKFIRMTNGIDFKRFDKIQIERNPYRLFYSSSADRGLDTLLYLFPFMKEKLPLLELHIFYGFNTWEAAIRQRNNPEEIQKMEEIKKAMSQPGVFYHGRVGQNELAAELKKCSLWAYPTDFEETFCCLPETKILTINGSKCIDQVNLGEKVLTHTGKFEKVSKIFKREINENIAEIKVTGLKDPLKITLNHKILALKKLSNLCVKRTSKLTKHPSVCSKRGDQCWFQGGNYLVKGICEKLFDPYKPEWVSANELNKGDYVTYPRNKRIEKPGFLSDYLDKENYNIKNKFIFRKNLVHTSVYEKSKIRDFKITNSFLEVCGWYVAEGCSKDSIRFVLGKHELKESEFIKNVFIKFGKHVNTTETKDNSRITTISSDTLCEFFSLNFGIEAKQKKIPQWIKDLDPNYLKYFLRGLLKGDGCISHEKSVFASSSPQLVLDLFNIFIKFGCVPFMRNYLNNGIINKRENGKHILKQNYAKKHPMVRLDCLLFHNKGLCNFLGYKMKKNAGRFRYLMDNDYVYLQISDKKTLNYKGKVYNLEVEQDNTYIANGVIVHNCITAIEAQRAGVPVIASNYAGLRTTVGDSGVLIGGGNKGESFTREYRLKFFEECMNILTDREKWNDWSRKGFENSEKYSWAKLADRWEVEFKK